MFITSPESLMHEAYTRFSNLADEWHEKAAKLEVFSPEYHEAVARGHAYREAAIQLLDIQIAANKPIIIETKELNV